MARFKFGKSKRKDDPNASIDDESNNLMTQSPKVSEELHQVRDGNSKSINHGNYGANTTAHPLPSSPPITTSGNQPILTLNGHDEPISAGDGFDNVGTTNQDINPHQNPAIVDGVSPWTKFKLKNSPFPRYRHAASNISSDKNEVYLMGGLKEGSVFGDTWRIVPSINQHNQLEGYYAENIVISNSNNPPARVGHSSVLIGNAFIIYGGDTVDTDFNGFPDNNFYLFNVNNNKYTIPSHILNKPNGRYGHTIGVVSLNNQSSRLYLFGGQLENDVFNDLYYFELNTFKSPKARWELVEPLNNFRPPPLTNHSMSVYKNKIYVFGGVYNNEKVSNDLWCFDTVSLKWNQINTTGNIPLPANEHSACIINDSLYIYGGNDFSGIIYNSLYVLNLHTLVWSKLIPEGEIDGPGARCGHSMTYIPNLNKLLIMGGDKNDYVSDDQNDFGTYETKDPSQMLDTMIYQLDLSIVESYLSSRQTVVKSTQKALIANSNSNLPPSNIAPNMSNPTLMNNSAGKAVAGATAGAAAGALGAIGLSAGINNGNDGSTAPLSSTREDLSRHARSFSAGPEEFRTPAASPERKPFEPQEDKFVEVPSTAQSEKDLTTEDELESPVKNVVPSSRELNNNFENNNYSNGVTKQVDDETNYHNGHAKYIESDRFDNNSTPNLSKSGENEKVKQLINELTAQLNDLKKSTKLEMQNATEKINQLESENKSLKTSNISDLQAQLTEKDEIIQELKQQIDPSLLAVNPDDESNVSGSRSINSGSINDLTKFKLDRINLNNKLIYLTKENKELNTKLTHFEPFMNNQIGELSKFQKIIKSQEEKINSLSQKVKGEEVLQKELNDWKYKYENLSIEYNNFKTIHEDDEFSDDELDQTQQQLGDDHDITNKSIMSNSTTKKTKQDLSSHLENLVNLWSTNQRGVASSKSLSASGENDKAINGETNERDAVDPMVIELQKQLDQLMKVSKEQEISSAREINSLRESSALEINGLKTELSQRLQNLKTFEENYKDALQSVNNTSKALNLTQDELNNQKHLMDKLVKENNELKLFKKASKRISSRQPLLQNASVDNFSLSQPIKEESEVDSVNEDDEEESNIENAHYNMKIKDLEADLYILKQERDQLKDNVTSLLKQLYLAQNNT